MTRGEQEFYRNIERIARALEALVKLFNNGKQSGNIKQWFVQI